MNTLTSTYKKNIDLNSTTIKNKILKYLYGKINTQTEFKNITSEEDLNDIRDNDYIICPRFNGVRSWIIFFQIEDNYYAVNFPKHSQKKKYDLFIHPIDINVSKDFYHGTIMEGIFYKINENCYLIIDEVYYLAGQNQLLKPKDDRLEQLSYFLTANIVFNPTYNMQISQFFQVNKKNLKELYTKIKSDTKIQEIIFYPKTFGRKIYNYTIMDYDLIDNVIKLSTFRFQKTTSPDVYNLLTVSSGKKLDIAYIPDMETSKKCKQWFKDNKVKELLVRCQMNMDKKKWIPLEIIEDDVNELDDADKSDDEVAEV